MNKKAKSAAAKARAAIDNAIEASEIAGVEVDLEPLDPAAMAKRGLAEGVLEICAQFSAASPGLNPPRLSS